VFPNYRVDLSSLMAGWTDIYWSRGLNKVLPDCRVDLIFPCYHSLRIFFFFNSNSSKSCLISSRIFLWKIHKHLCNALGLHDMHVSLLGLKYRPPSMMLHHHRVPLFTIQNLLSFSDSPAHSSLLYVNPPLKCKCSIYPRCPWWLLLSLFIKSNHAPKCGFAWFIIKEINKSLNF
jgi:hypothetical protein